MVGDMGYYGRSVRLVVMDAKEDEHLCEKKFLSTMDLIRMLRFEYKPFWMSKEDKAKIVPLEVQNAAPAA